MVGWLATTIVASGAGAVEWLNKWFTDQTSTPVGSILMFLLVFLVRVVLDRQARKAERKRQDKARRKGHASG